MSNTYTVPSTINFYGAGFTSSLIYHNYQVAASTVTNNVQNIYSTHTAFTPNVITVPMIGDYVISIHTGAYAPFSTTRANYRLFFTNGTATTITGGTLSSGNATVTVNSTVGFPSSGSIIINAEEITYTGTTPTTLTGCTRAQNGTSATNHANATPVTYFMAVGDVTTNVYLTPANVAISNSFFRKVTFTTAGAWTLTPQWKPDSAGTIKVDSGSAYYPWLVLLHGTNPLDATNQQLTQFVNSSYTLMTNMDTNAWWGTQTTTNIVNNTNNVASNTSSIGSLSTQVNTLSTHVSNLASTVSGLTSIAVTSGGIRIKP